MALVKPLLLRARGRRQWPPGDLGAEWQSPRAGPRSGEVWQGPRTRLEAGLREHS